MINYLDVCMAKMLSYYTLVLRSNLACHFAIISLTRTEGARGIQYFGNNVFD